MPEMNEEMFFDKAASRLEDGERISNDTRFIDVFDVSISEIDNPMILASILRFLEGRSAEKVVEKLEAYVKDSNAEPKVLGYALGGCLSESLQTRLTHTLIQCDENGSYCYQAVRMRGGVPSPRRLGKLGNESDQLLTEHFCTVLGFPKLCNLILQMSDRFSDVSIDKMALAAAERASEDPETVLSALTDILSESQSLSLATRRKLLERCVSEIEFELLDKRNDSSIKTHLEDIVDHLVVFTTSETEDGRLLLSEFLESPSGIAFKRLVEKWQHDFRPWRCQESFQALLDRIQPDMQCGGR